MITRPFSRRLAACTLFSATLLGAGAATAATPAQTLATLRANTGGALLERGDLATAYTMLRAAGETSLLLDDPAMPAVARAQAFLAFAGPALGIADPESELRLSRVSIDRGGRTHVHLDQVRDGVAVFGARVVVHLNDVGVYGVNGAFVRDLASAPKAAAFSAEQLRATALQVTSKRYPGKTLQVESERPIYYRSGLLDGLHLGRTYLAREVIVAGDGLRERWILDSQTGGVINRIDGLQTLLHRQIYTPQYHNTLVLEEGDALAPADPPFTGDAPSDPLSRVPRSPVDNLYIFAGGTYQLYKNLFGREGYDDGFVAPEMQRQESVYLVNEQCPNAYWNSTSTNYCPGFDADDVVSHEWSHAYTEYTHGLIYQYQSGALNESYSDIFGETYDLVNGIEGPLGASLTEGEYYENGGSRWVVGEDLSEAASLILLRDMWDPDAFGVLPSPGSVSSPNYTCSSAVHTNSGVPNHAYAMLVDGKEFNGVTIPAIGMTKAAHIYFHAETHYQTPTTNFPQHAEALMASCQDLIGVPLNDVLGNPSVEQITSADCDAVDAAMTATQMRQDVHEICEYQTLLQPEFDTPAVCEAGKYEAADHAQDWEQGAGGWTVSDNFTGDAPAHSSWVLTDQPFAPHTGKAMFAQNLPTGGAPGSGRDISGSTRLDSPQITLTDDASFLRFTHNISAETGFDGGNLKFSLNGGDFAIVPASAIIFNPYNATLGPPAPDLPVKPPVEIPDPTGLTSGNSNPMAGEAAWSGSDEGETYGSWGTSIVDLAALGAKTGDTLQLRFEFGNDFTSGNVGWYVDEVAVLHCSATPPIGGPPVVLPPVTVTDNTRFGGALGLLFLLPLAGLAALRRRRG